MIQPVYSQSNTAKGDNNKEGAMYHSDMARSTIIRDGSDIYSLAGAT